MSVYMVLIPPGAQLEAMRLHDLDRTVLIKDGFCWPALFFSLPWLLVRRLWLVLVVYLVAGLLLEAGARLAGGPAPGVAAVLFALFFALEANGLRRWTLERRGWRQVATIEARNAVEAEQRFFSRLSASAGGQPADTGEAASEHAPAPDVRSAQAPARGLVPRIGGERVVGLSLGPAQG
jgi:hypothetical protein